MIYEAFTQCCFNVGPASKTVGQHWNSIGWMPRVCCNTWLCRDKNSFLSFVRHFPERTIIAGGEQCPANTALFGWQTWLPCPIHRHKMPTQILDMWLVEIAISTNQLLQIWVSRVENTSPGSITTISQSVYAFQSIRKFAMFLIYWHNRDFCMS